MLSSLRTYKKWAVTGPGVGVKLLVYDIRTVVRLLLLPGAARSLALVTCCLHVVCV